MILIGMFDSPFVRRVAIALTYYELAFEHRAWSVGRDFERIRQFNPLGRVPTLVLDGGEALIESSAILDYLDDTVGVERSLLPRSGPERRAALQLLAVATGAAEKGILQIYERVFRPEPKRHEGWLERCRQQMQAALAELDRQCRACGDGWLAGARMTHADIAAACVYTFLNDALGVDAADRYPALRALAHRCESLPAFTATRVTFDAPS